MSSPRIDKHDSASLECFSSALLAVRFETDAPAMPRPLELEIFSMALCIEIRIPQVAELMRDRPGISEAELDELIVRRANDRRQFGSHLDRGVYVNMAMTPLKEFKERVRYEMTTGAAWVN
jgi:hypothetical protein